MAWWAMALMSINQIIHEEIQSDRSIPRRVGDCCHPRSTQKTWLPHPQAPQASGVEGIYPLSPPLVRGETKALSPPRPKASPSPYSPPLLSRAGGVKRETAECYLLTYQPAPISAWVLHPQNDDADRQTIETIIQSAIKKQPANITRRAS